MRGTKSTSVAAYTLMQEIETTLGISSRKGFRAEDRVPKHRGLEKPWLRDHRKSLVTRSAGRHIGGCAWNSADASNIISCHHVCQEVGLPPTHEDAHQTKKKKRKKKLSSRALGHLLVITVHFPNLFQVHIMTHPNLSFQALQEM